MSRTQPPPARSSARTKKSFHTLEDESMDLVRQLAAETNRTGRVRKQVERFTAAASEPTKHHHTNSTPTASTNKDEAVKKKRSRSVRDVDLELLSPADQELQRSAYDAICAHDPLELQRILRPSIEQRYTIDEWMGLTPLQLAELEPAFDFTAIGFEVYGRDKINKEVVGTTLLHVAALQHSIPCMRVLLRNGCDINILDTNLGTPLNEAVCEGGHLEGIDFLLYEGADVHVKDRNRNTVLHTACREATKQIVARLVGANIDLEVADRMGFTAIYWTLDHKNKQEGIDIAHYLVQSGANVNHMANKNQTLLFWCISKILDDYDVYVSARDAFDPEDVIRNCHQQCVERLPMLEYLLTIENIDVRATSEWPGKNEHRDKTYSGDVFFMVDQFIRGDRDQEKLTLKEEMFRKRRIENKKHAAIGKRLKKEWQEQLYAAQQAAAEAEAHSAAPLEPEEGEHKQQLHPDSMSDINSSATTSSTSSHIFAPPPVEFPAHRVPKCVVVRFKWNGRVYAATLLNVTRLPLPDVDDVDDGTTRAAANTRKKKKLGKLDRIEPVGQDEVAENGDEEECKNDPHPKRPTQDIIPMEIDDDGEERKDYDPMDTPMTDVSQPTSFPSVSPSPTSNSDDTPQPPAKKAEKFAIDMAHFIPRYPNTDCHICQQLYPQETIPETCARLIFMELLRRATSEGDFGNLKEVERLIKQFRENDDYSYLKKRILRYHQHGTVPRVGPIHIASSYENEGEVPDLRILTLLQSSRIEDVTVNDDGFNALQVVCAVGDVVTVDQFIKTGFDVNATGSQMDAYTPLMLCCDSLTHGGAIAERLLKAGAILTTRDDFKNTAFQWAVYKGNIGVLTVLIKHAIQLRTESQHATQRLIKATATSARQKAKVTMAVEVPVVEVDPFSWPNHWGNTIMHYACYKGFKSEGHFECLQLLLKNDIPIDEPKNLSGLVPRQVVAGFNDKELRGKRVLALLNSPSRSLVIPQPKYKEIEEESRKLTPLTEKIHRILNKSEKEDDLSNQDKTQLRALRKEWTPLDQTLQKLKAESQALLEQELKKYPDEYFDLNGKPTPKMAGASLPGSHGPAPTTIYPKPYLLDDISHGREWTKIRLVNDQDETGGLDYKYITHCLPHPFFSFPLPLAQIAEYDPANDHSTSKSAQTAQKLSEKQQADRLKVKAKQQKLDDERQQKQRQKNAKGKQSQRKPSKPPVILAKKHEDAIKEDTQLPRCDCVGPNSCMDSSCACFRKYTEKILSEKVKGSASSSSSKELADPAAEAVAQMGRLCGRIEQLCNCHELCGCRLDCANRHIAGGIQVKLVIVKTLNKGWACVADEFIPKGTFICEYVGEIVPPHVAAERLVKYDQEGVHYVFGFQESDVCIDPVKIGNVARTINHSCNPNLTKIQIYGSCMRGGKRFPKMAFFAAREIAKGDELCISYDYEDQEHPGGCLVCYCGEKNCKHTLV